MSESTRGSGDPDPARPDAKIAGMTVEEIRGKFPTTDDYKSSVVNDALCDRVEALERHIETYKAGYETLGAEIVRLRKANEQGAEIVVALGVAHREELERLRVGSDKSLREIDDDTR